MKFTPPFTLPRSAKSVATKAIGLALAAAALTGCLSRPIGRGQPRTTNVIVDTLVQSAVDKIDLLFVVDNSISMADKQEILALAVPDLVGRLVSPVCVQNGAVVDSPPSSKDKCKSGAREFNPINDIHIGIVTSSLGGFGAEIDCQGVGNSPDEAQQKDMAYLLGSLPRGATAAGDAAGTGFLSWTSTSNKDAFTGEFSKLVAAAGEHGCGWEATLEAWYRFLVEPYPYTKITRLPCNTSDTANSCAGPERDPGTMMQLVDLNILNQRKQFLRPDSLLAIVMLTDENDCSFKASGQTWRLAQTQSTMEGGEAGYFGAFKSSAACASNPNDPCCQSCGQPNVASGCATATATDANGMTSTVAAGCENGRKFVLEDKGDHPNLRCFQQKRRFGVDYLYPVARYSTALREQLICPYSETLDKAYCDDKGLTMVANPIYSDLQYTGGKDEVPAVPRNKNLIFLAGILGVPWQDVAVDKDAATLKYRVAKQDAEDADRIDWDLILGPDDPANGIQMPTDPLMQESVDPRMGQGIAPPGSGYNANPVNGHEWTITDQSDLQYACVFPLAEEKPCPTADEADAQRQAGMSVSNCDCTDYPGDDWGNPLCQNQNGTFDSTQRRAKAYPGLRELQVLKAYGDNSIVASICPKVSDIAQKDAADFGYRPAVAAIVDRLKEQLADKCLTRELAVKDGPNGKEAACKIIEAKRLRAGDAPMCDASAARTPVQAEIDPIVRATLLSKEQCSSEADCKGFQLCTITQLTGDEQRECLTSETAAGNGWCYVDPTLVDDDALKQQVQTLVQKCPPTAQRKLRFVGQGTPEPNTITLFACAGQAFD
jgi:hypothetical protein